MADQEYSTKIKIEADTTGAEKAASAFGGVTKAAGAFRKVLTGFGVVGLFTTLISGIRGVADSFKAAKLEADQFAADAKRAADAAELKDLADGWRSIAENIDAASKTREHDAKIAEQQMAGLRALADAQLELQMQRELAAVDATDPAAAEKRAAIQASYASRRGENAAERAVEDIDVRRKELAGEADSARAAAAAKEAELKKTDSAIADRKKRMEAARDASYAENEDDGGFLSAWGSAIKNLATLNWGALSWSGMTRTDEGDARRTMAAEEAKRLEGELASLKARKAEEEKAIADLRQKADRAEETRAGLTVQREAAVVSLQAAQLSGTNTTNSAQNALAKKQAQIEKDQATIAAGRQRIAEIQAQIAAENAKGQAAAAATQKEETDVMLAQGRLGSLDSTIAQQGRPASRSQREERKALVADVEREMREADLAKTQLNRTLAKLANVIKGLNQDLRKVQSEVSAALRRQSANQMEAPPNG